MFLRFSLQSQKLCIHVKMKDVLSHIVGDLICEDEPNNCLLLTRMSLKIALTRETELE